MRYIDTSVLLAFLVPEAGSRAAEALMTSDGEPLVVSTWGQVRRLAPRCNCCSFDAQADGHPEVDVSCALLDAARGTGG